MPLEAKLWIQRVALGLAALVFVGAGVMHFVRPAFFVAIVPPFLPAPLALVYVSGVFELLGGVGLLIPRARRWAAYGLIALLIAVFPANIYMAVEAERFAAELKVSPAALFVRLPIQLVLIAWVYAIATPVTSSEASTTSDDV